jgi:hypothetical protein
VTIERTYYTVRELQKGSPEGFARALDEYARQECEWQDWSDEWASLKALDEVVGYQRGYARYGATGMGSAEDFTGRRAWAWLENVVLADYRIPWEPISRPGRRRKVAGYGSHYRAGMVEPCPFTGFYMDELLIEDLRESLRAGMSVGDAMRVLQAEVVRVIDDEMDYRTSEEAFVEKATDLDWEFTSSGQRV